MIKRGEMPNDWEWRSLGSLVDDPKQDLVDGPFGSNLKSDEYVQDGIPVLKIQNIKAERFIDKKFSYVSALKAEQLKRHSFQAGDLIITKLGDPLGLCCKVPQKYTSGIIVADLMRLRPSKTKINQDYLIKVINSDVVQKQFKSITKGTTRPRVNLSIVRDLQIPVPPEPIQRAIVSKIEELFSELDKGIENLWLAQQQLKTYRQSVLKWAFEGKLTSASEDIPRTGIEQKKEPRYGLEPLSMAAEEQGEYGGKLPKEWKWVKLGDVCTSVEYGSAAKSQETGKVPVLRMGNIQNGRFDWNDLVYTDDENEINKYLLKRDDVLFNRTNSAELVGKTAIYKGEQPAVFAGYLIRINRIETLIDADYLNYYLNTKAAKQYGNTVRSFGVNQSNINGTKLKSYPIPLAPLEEQKIIVTEIEKRFSVADEMEECINQSLQQAEALRQSILKKAFEGKLS